MRKFVIVNIIVITLFLIGICIVEDVVVTNGVNEVNEGCIAIEELIDGRDDLRYMDIVMAVENLEYRWQQNESKMCYMVFVLNILVLFDIGIIVTIPTCWHIVVIRKHVPFFQATILQ